MKFVCKTFLLKLSNGSIIKCNVKQKGSNPEFKKLFSFFKVILFHFKHFEDKRPDLDKLIHTVTLLQKGKQIQRFGKENGTPQLPNHGKQNNFSFSEILLQKLLHNSFLGELWQTAFLEAS